MRYFTNTFFLIKTFKTELAENIAKLPTAQPNQLAGETHPCVPQAQLPTVSEVSSVADPKSKEQTKSSRQQGFGWLEQGRNAEVKLGAYFCCIVWSC